MDAETKQVMVSMLEMLKLQAVLSDRLLGWGLAVADTLRKNPQFEALLREHPSFDQGHVPDLQTTGGMIRNIDALIRQLKD